MRDPRVKISINIGAILRPFFFGGLLIYLLWFTRQEVNKIVTALENQHCNACCTVIGDANSDLQHIGK